MSIIVPATHFSVSRYTALAAGIVHCMGLVRTSPLFPAGIFASAVALLTRLQRAASQNRPRIGREMRALLEPVGSMEQVVKTLATYIACLQGLQSGTVVELAHIEATRAFFLELHRQGEAERSAELFA